MDVGRIAPSSALGRVDTTFGVNMRVPEAPLDVPIPTGQTPTDYYSTFTTSSDAGLAQERARIKAEFDRAVAAAGGNEAKERLAAHDAIGKQINFIDETMIPQANQAMATVEESIKQMIVRGATEEDLSEAFTVLRMIRKWSDELLDYRKFLFFLMLGLPIPDDLAARLQGNHFMSALDQSLLQGRQFAKKVLAPMAARAAKNRQIERVEQERPKTADGQADSTMPLGVSAAITGVDLLEAFRNFVS